MGIVVHHLNNSRSQRVLWLLEELGVEYEIIHYQRDPVTNLAPPELKAINPLGKSPLLEIDGRVIEESGAIVQVLCDRYGSDRFLPATGSDDALRHLELMHFAEGSAMLPIMLNIYLGRLGEGAAPVKPRIAEQMAAYFGYLESILDRRRRDAQLSGRNLCDAGQHGVLSKTCGICCRVPRPPGLATRPGQRRAIFRDVTPIWAWTGSANGSVNVSTDCCDHANWLVPGRMLA